MITRAIMKDLDEILSQEEDYRLTDESIQFSGKYKWFMTLKEMDLCGKVVNIFKRSDVTWILLDTNTMIKPSWVKRELNTYWKYVDIDDGIETMQFFNEKGESMEGDKIDLRRFKKLEYTRTEL